MTQVGIERALGNTQLLCNVLGAHLAFPEQRLGGVGRRFERPPRRPRARAADKPARVRSRMNSRSNSASEANRLKVRRPCEVVMPIGSFKLFSPTLRAIRSLTRSTRCCSDRPSRSSFQMTRTSPARRFSSSFTKTGRSLRAAHNLGVNLRAAGLLQGVNLHRDRLILGAHARVTDFHGVV